jgi:hypothetical protein
VLQAQFVEALFARDYLVPSSIMNCGNVQTGIIDSLEDSGLGPVAKFAIDYEI